MESEKQDVNCYSKSKSGDGAEKFGSLLPTQTLTTENYDVELEFDDLSEDAEGYELFYGNEDLDNLDFTEEPLDFEPPLLHSHGFRFGKSKISKEQLLAEGVSIRSGKWLKKEDNILRHNWNDFTEKFGVSDPLLLLGINKGYHRTMLKFVINKKLYVRLGRGLNDRTLYSIYLRARALFHPCRSKKRLSVDELQKLKKLYIRYGNDMGKISYFMNKASSTCREAHRWSSNKVNNGSWSTEEDAKLNQAVTDIVGEENLTTEVHGLPWDNIAKLVGTRSHSQCRIHWLQKLCWKPEAEKRTWSTYEDAFLIYLIFFHFSESDVDWDLLFSYKHFHDYSCSYLGLQRHWQILKSKVPFYTTKDHEDIVLYLYHRHLPTLLQKLGITIEQLKKQAILLP